MTKTINFLLFVLSFTITFAIGASYAVDSSSVTTPPGYVVPRISRTDPPQKIRESKSCREYLTICERSCKERGEMFKFACIGQDFQPFEDHSRCTCSDDLYSRREAPRQKQIQVMREQGESEK